MSAREVAATLGVSAPQVYLMARDRHLPSVRIGPQVLRFKTEDVQNFIEMRRVANGN
jgi:excisionase family DNA binding protein